MDTHINPGGRCLPAWLNPRLQMEKEQHQQKDSFQLTCTDTRRSATCQRQPHFYPVLELQHCSRVSPASHLAAPAPHTTALAGTQLPHAVLEPQKRFFAVPSIPDPDPLTEMCTQTSCNSHKDGCDALRAIIMVHERQKNSIPGLPAAIVTHVIVPEVTSFYKSLRTVAATLHLHFITHLQLLFRLLRLYIPGATEGAWLCATQQCSDTASRAVKTAQQQNSQGSNSKWCWSRGF